MVKEKEKVTKKKKKGAGLWKCHRCGNPPKVASRIFLMADSHSGLEKPRKDGSAFPHFHKARLRFTNIQFPFP